MQMSAIESAPHRSSDREGDWPSVKPSLKPKYDYLVTALPIYDLASMETNKDHSLIAAMSNHIEIASLDREHLRPDLEKAVRYYEARFNIRFECVVPFSRHDLARLHSKNQSQDSLLFSRVNIRSKIDHSIIEQISIMSKIANSTTITIDQRRSYFNALMTIYSKFPRDFKQKPLDDKNTFIGIEREGRILAQALGCLAAPHSLRPHAKRIWYNGGLLVGIAGMKVPRISSAYTIIDGAIASGSTIIALMEQLRDAATTFRIYSAHAAMEGLLAIMRYALYRNIQVEIFVGHATFGLDHHFYAVSNSEPTKLVVGDLGDTIWPLYSGSFDD